MMRKMLNGMKWNILQNREETFTVQQMGGTTYPAQIFADNTMSSVCSLQYQWIEPTRNFLEEAAGAVP